MTVLLETSIKRFTGISTDSKPTSVPAGSYFWEYDTNDVYKTYDGTNWLIHNAKSITQASVETLDFSQAVADYPLYTATSGVVRVLSFTLTNTTDHSADAGAFTGMSVIATDGDTTALVAQAAGVKANLTAAAVFTFSTPFTLLVGEIINYHVYGAASTLAGPFVVSVTYQVLTPAGYLA
jgi:hypothetical protein